MLFRSLFFGIYFKDKEFISISDLKYIGNCRSSRPGKVGYMSKAIKTVYGNKRTEIGSPFNFSFYNVANLNAGEKFIFSFKFNCLFSLALFLKNNALGSDNFFF